MQQLLQHILTIIYLFKFNNRSIRKSCGICAKLTVKKPELHQRCHSGFFIVNFEHILQFFLVFLLLTLKCFVGYYRILGSIGIKGSLTDTKEVKETYFIIAK